MDAQPRVAVVVGSCDAAGRTSQSAHRALGSVRWSIGKRNGHGLTGSETDNGGLEWANLQRSQLVLASAGYCGGQQVLTPGW
jgi:hypothetical protein